MNLQTAKVNLSCQVTSSRLRVLCVYLKSTAQVPHAVGTPCVFLFTCSGNLSLILYATYEQSTDGRIRTFVSKLQKSIHQ